MEREGLEEIVVISGKGGTGKTSVAASFAVLARRTVLADCDVDASDLHLLLMPRIHERHEMSSGHRAVIRENDCRQCGVCAQLCRFGAIQPDTSRDGTGTPTIDPIACEGCGVCARFCPAMAIDMLECACGEWMISDTRCGPMVHARLAVAAENSGKLVHLVRQAARHLAQEHDIPLVIIDGPPGIGCPVIASLTGASRVLVVTEPTVTGEHDLVRALDLTQHFALPSAVCVNKWDLNAGMTERIETLAHQRGARVVGRIRYDTAVTKAQIKSRAVVETDAPSAGDVRKVWLALMSQ